MLSKLTPPEYFFILVSLRVPQNEVCEPDGVLQSFFMGPLKFRHLWTVIGYGWVILVVVLSLSSSLSPPVDFFWEDKLYHLLAYGFLMLWFAQLHPRSRYGWLVCGFIAQGILLEVLQSQTGIRIGEVWDAVANSLGVILSWGLALNAMNTMLHQFEERFLRCREED